ncbi:MAG: SHOCT domain-containing protein [Acidobacteriota bacterium]
MSKASALIHYTATMAVFKKWLAAGIISEDELTKIETAIANKYGLPVYSIYRQNA